MEMGVFEVMASRQGKAIGLSELATAVNADLALLSEFSLPPKLSLGGMLT